MICLIQRVSSGAVTVDHKVIGKIEQGLVVLSAFQPEDSEEKINKMIHKLLNYRLFADENDKMNLNVQQISGALLLVPQFTLAADTKKGLRPSFSTSAPPDIANQYFNYFVKQSELAYPYIQTGQFGADMQVSINNNGPVTFWLET